MEKLYSETDLFFSEQPNSLEQWQTISDWTGCFLLSNLWLVSGCFLYFIRTNAWHSSQNTFWTFQLQRLHFNRFVTSSASCPVYFKKYVRYSVANEFEMTELKRIDRCLPSRLFQYILDPLDITP